VALTLDEEGIPTTSEKRLEIASNIIDTAKLYGIPEENILVDPLVLTASAEQQAVMETLKAIPLIKNKYNVKIVLGTSNVSFGLPNRKLLNTTYLAMALGFGLDAPITDSTNEALMGVIRSFKVLANQDKDSKDYINAYSNVVVENTVTTSNTDLKEIIIKGLKDEAKKVSLELLEQYSSIEIVNEFMIPALDIVGERYEKQEIFLPQLIRSAETSKIVFEALKEKSIKEGVEIIDGNKILLATVKGDIHDIGKNIVKLILENYGYKIIDLGKDVSIEKIVETVQKENISLVGLSALMTTTVKNMEHTIKQLKQSSPNVKIMVGGAVLTPDYATKIGADYFAKDAREAIDIAKKAF
jgi:5-methyltetrahydrofolate--homocysteine methyltransferase